MNAKEYLQQINKINHQIKNTLEEVAMIKTMAVSITVATDCERVQTSGTTDRMAETIAKYMDMADEINRDVNRYSEIRREVHNTINQVTNPDYVDILEKRYINHMSWEQIAVDMGYTYRWVTKLHGKALHEIDRILQNRKSVPINS